MMMHRQDSPAIHGRPRSNSHPVLPQRVRRPPGSNESTPVRPPRNPIRPVTLGEEHLAPTPGAFKPTTAFVDDHREGEIDGERYRPPVNVPPPKSPVNRKQPPLPQINTLDRKILQELRQSMLARSAQFTLKNKTKHHPFPPEEVPYPRSYDHKCIDTDVWESMFCEQFCGNVTFHTFDVPPTKVLDLGCGSGSWIMTCARRWKDCHFVGLDIVPLHPDLGQSELSQRVSWVQANFLEPLPFPNEEFDFVHIKRIARGVPEHKWDALFEEITRVMKPGAALEMLEEDLYIPGQIMDSADSGPPLSAATSSDSSDDLSQPYTPSIPGPSTSLPDISIDQGYPISQVVRRSTSERSEKRPSAGRATSKTLPPPLPIRQTPSNVRPFPMLKPSNPTNRPILNLHNLLPKRAGTVGGLPRKTKKESTAPVSLSVGLVGRLSTSSPYSNAIGSSSNPMLGSNTSITILPIPAQNLDKFGERDPALALPPAESTNGKLEVGFPQNGQNDDQRRTRSRSFSCPTPEDDGQRRTTTSHEFGPFDLSTVGMHDHAQQIRSSNVRNSRNSNFLADVEPTESNRRDKKLSLVPPPLPAKDIPGRSKPRAIPYGLLSNEFSNSTTGLSRSAPDRSTDHFDRNGSQLLSPTFEPSKPMKSLSTSSLAISTNRSIGQISSSQRSGYSNGNSGAGSITIHSPSAEMPPNPRQHKLLEVIYTEMHAARFVNLAPLSLLENYIRTYFKNVRTHAPLIFAFPPPPGCEHRPEFDALEAQQRRLNQTQKAEDDDDQDRYQGPDTPPSTRSLTPSPSVPRRSSLKSIPPLPAPRERSHSVTSNGPGPSRTRSLGKAIHPSTTSLETTNHRKPRPRSSKFPVRPADVTVSDRLVVTGDGLLTGTSEYVMMDASVVGGLSPARVVRAAQNSASSASDERECSRQRSDSLFTRSDGVEGGGDEGRKRLLTSVPGLARPSAGYSIPTPPLFEYKTPNATSLVSLSPSVTSSSSSATIQCDPGRGKQGPTAAERAQLSVLPNNKAEVDIRSLNLHLRARVVEILGCSETMWDWVKEFQHRESEKERKRKEQLTLTPKKVQGVGGGRVSYYHRDHVRSNRGRERVGSMESDHSALRRRRSTKSLTAASSSQKPFVKVSGNVAESPTSYFTTSSGSVKAEDPSERLERSVKQELLHMTRERFDEVLSWFQFDMDDAIRLTRSMAVRTPSIPFTNEPTEQRKSFDVACQKLETHLQLHPQLPTSLFKPNGRDNGYGAASGSPGNSRYYEEGLCCLPPLLNLVHPSKRLCRTIRVWVAWKP